MLTNSHDTADDAPWIVPFDRNPRFTGRESQLTKLEEKLVIGDQTTKIAITGLGGVGKTQLVLELVYRTRAKHNNCSIIWIPATNRESLEQAYLDVAKQLGIPGCEEDKADVKRLVQDHLSNESTGQWLLVFDNADDIDMWIGKSEQGSGRLIEYLPKSKQGSIIFTTREADAPVTLWKVLNQIAQFPIRIINIHCKYSQRYRTLVATGPHFPCFNSSTHFSDVPPCLLPRPVSELLTMLNYVCWTFSPCS